MNRYPRRRMMTAAEAAEYGLGAARGILIGLFWSSLFWTPVVLAFAWGQGWRP